MDFEPILGQVQGALLKANNVFGFANLLSRGGNETRINNVVEIVLKTLSGNGFISDGTIVFPHYQVLRKINFFLILNTDLRLLEELVNSDDIGHLIWITPTISKCLLVHLIWGLDFHQFLCEAVKYCEPSLSLEILEVAAQNVKYSTPQESVQRASTLISSAYEMIVRMSKRALKVKDQKLILDGTLNQICDLLKYFGDPPNQSKMSTWTMDQLYLHAGNAMYTFLENLIHCFVVFLNEPPVVPEDCQLYLVTFDDSENKSFSEKQDNMDDIVAEYITKLNGMLLESAKHNVMAINVDIFCSWCECKDEKDSSKVLQQSIGELAYALCEILKSDDRFDNEVISMLPTISYKPECLTDRIQNADRDTFLENASINSAEQNIWMASLIKKNYFFSDEKCINCAVNNIAVISHDDCISILKSCIEILYGNVKYEFADDIKMLLLKCLASQPINEQMSLIQNSFSEIGDALELPDYEKKLTELFNKLLELTDCQLTEIYSLFIQNPCKFYSKTFKECLNNMQQTSVMLNALERLKVFDNIQIKHDFDITSYTCHNNSMTGIPLLIFHTIKEIDVGTINSEANKLSYIHLMKGIVDKDLISGEIILLKVMMPAIHKYLSETNYSCLQLYLLALQEVFCSIKHAKYIAPLLVMLGQVMEAVRWNLATFTATSVEVLESTIVFQTSTLKTFLQNKQPTDTEFKWLISKLNFLTPMNAYYFQQLWPHKSFEELYDTTLNPKDSLSCLCYLLPRCSLAEWKNIFSGMSMQNNGATNFVTLCSVIKLIATSAKDINTEKAFSCLEFCYRNAANSLQESISTVSNVSNSEAMVLFSEVVALVNSAPEKSQQTCFTAFLVPLSRLISLYMEPLDPSDPEMAILTQAIEKLHHENSRKILEKLCAKYV